MSFHVYFAFSIGLEHPIAVPAGTKAAILAHVGDVEETLGLKRTKYKDNPVRWDHFDPEYRAGFPSVDDKTLCETVERHNRWVIGIYENFEKWAENPPADGEPLTPADAAEFWHGLHRLEVRPERWTIEYFRARMESLYEVMRGRKSDGVTFDAKPLTPRQAAAVIRIFDPFLDANDLRLDVPDGCDFLASSYDGGYDWCEKCGAVLPENGAACRKRKCPLRSVA